MPVRSVHSVQFTACVCILTAKAILNRTCMKRYHHQPYTKHLGVVSTVVYHEFQAASPVAEKLCNPCHDS